MQEKSRRDVLVAALSGGAVLLAPECAFGAGFPARNIQFLIPYGAGGGFDSYVRIVSPAMEKQFPNRVSIVPVNNTAGGGARAISQLYRARPDGYTIGIFDVPGMFIMQQAQGNTAYDLNRFSWIGCMGEGEHYLLCTGAKSPLKTIDDLKALSKKRPVTFAVAGIDGTATSAAIIACQMLGIRIQMIPGYKGSADYIVAAMRGDCDAVIAAMSTGLRYAKAGSIRVLADFEQHSRIPGVADATSLGVPELADITIERPIAGPPGLPKEIQTVLGAALAKAQADPAVGDWARRNDIVMASKTPAETVALIARQRAFFDKWKKYLAHA